MNEQLGAFLTLVIQAVVAIAVPVLGAFLMAWAQKKIAQAKVKLTKDQLYLAETAIKIFVDAAEQSGLLVAALATGKAKKAWVLEKATTWCVEHGVPVDLPAIDAQIEALVRALNWEEAELEAAAKEVPAPAVITVQVVADAPEVAPTPDEHVAEVLADPNTSTKKS